MIDKSPSHVDYNVAFDIAISRDASANLNSFHGLALDAEIEQSPLISFSFTSRMPALYHIYFLTSTRQRVEVAVNKAALDAKHSNDLDFKNWVTTSLLVTITR